MNEEHSILVHWWSNSFHLACNQEVLKISLALSPGMHHMLKEIRIY